MLFVILAADFTCRECKYLSEYEFDVPSNTISKGGTDGWGIINGPGSLLDRLNAKKGLPRIIEMPNATNISIEGSK